MNRKIKKVKISPRELRCLRLLAEGYKSREIANELCIKPDTVRTFVRRLKAKYEIKVSDTHITQLKMCDE
jgi:DNA-binding CsgD family transcriptional regulator